jgi:hypothetical protein
MQYYTNTGNATVAGGELTITAKRKFLRKRIYFRKNGYKRKGRFFVWKI